MENQVADALMASFRRVLFQIQKLVKHLSKYHLDTDNLRNELTTIVLQSKLVLFDLSKYCTFKTQMKLRRRLLIQQPPHPLLVSVPTMPSTFDIDIILNYAEWLVTTIFNLIST